MVNRPINFDMIHQPSLGNMLRGNAEVMAGSGYTLAMQSATFGPMEVVSPQCTDPAPFQSQDPPSVQIGTIHSNDETRDAEFRCNKPKCSGKKFKRWADLKRHISCHGGVGGKMNKFWCPNSGCKFPIFLKSQVWLLPINMRALGIRPVVNTHARRQEK